MPTDSTGDTNFSSIILAAGYSERIGEAKLFLRLGNGYTFIEHIVRAFADFGCKEVITVINERDYKAMNCKNIALPNNSKIVVNPDPGKGRFYSLKIGLEHLEIPCNVFMHNIDNPFVNDEVLKKLLTQLPFGDYISPVYKGKGGHPALLSEKVVKEIIKEKSDGLPLKDYLSGKKRIKTEVGDERVLINVNTKSDYRKFLQ